MGIGCYFAANTIQIAFFKGLLQEGGVPNSNKLKHMTQFMLNRWTEIISTTDAENGHAENFGIFTYLQIAKCIPDLYNVALRLFHLQRSVSLNRNIKKPCDFGNSTVP